MEQKQILKTLKIKVGSLKRIHKEYDSYKKEEQKQRERIN
jgi:hypothetical protein